MDLIDHYTRSGLISDPTRHFRPCYGCGERFHPDDMHTIDIEKYGEHDTAEICDGCKESHADTPRIADIDLDAMSFDENVEASHGNRERQSDAQPTHKSP
jgi:hypothetical protein